VTKISVVTKALVPETEAVDPETEAKAARQLSDISYRLASQQT